MEDFKVSVPERQIIEVLREWTSGDNYRLEISRSLGAWEVTLSAPEIRKGSRGVGRTLDEAWDAMAPLGA